MLPQALNKDFSSLQRVEDDVVYVNQCLTLLGSIRLHLFHFVSDPGAAASKLAFHEKVVRDNNPFSPGKSVLKQPKQWKLSERPTGPTAHAFPPPSPSPPPAGALCAIDVPRPPVLAISLAVDGRFDLRSARAARSDGPPTDGTLCGHGAS